MKRSVTALAVVILSAALAGCGLFGDKKDERKNWTAAEYYKAAKEQFDAGNWEASAKIYEQLEGKFPYGRFAQQAQIEVAYAYYKQGETAQALSALDKFVKLHPNHPNLDYALYLRALVNFKEDLGILARLVKQDLADRDPKAARESFESFKDLVTRFPESRYTADSRQRMAYLVEALARHEINVARYYLSRGAYLAAANRAQDALKNYSTASIQRDGLEIMIEAYDRMGLAPLRDDSRRVLAQNFPADRMASTGNNRNAPWWKIWNGWF
jgi:outer membrane protein assembly factor BamD